MLSTTNDYSDDGNADVNAIIDSDVNDTPTATTTIKSHSNYGGNKYNGNNINDNDDNHISNNDDSNKNTKDDENDINRIVMLILIVS